ADFRTTQRRAFQQQIGDVSAGNQQHQRDHDEQYVDRGRKSSAHVRHSATAGFGQQSRVVFGIELRRRQLICFARRWHQFQGRALKSTIQTFASLFVSRAWFEPSHHIEPPDALFEIALLSEQQRFESQGNSNGGSIVHL